MASSRAMRSIDEVHDHDLVRHQGPRGHLLDEFFGKPAFGLGGTQHVARGDLRNAVALAQMTLA